jgi:hypothetical protein
MNKQKMLTSLTVVILTGSTLLAVPQAFAQSSGTSPRMNFFQELVQFFSQKFGLDKTQVKTALTDFKQQRKASETPRPTQTSQQIADREKTRLDKLVADGKISSDQETAIINELAAIRTKYNIEPGNTQTAEQSKTQMTAMREEIVSWAKSQGIDSSYVMPEVGIGNRPDMEGRGKGLGGHPGTISPTPAQ